MIIIPDLPDVQVEEVEVAFEITLTLRTTSRIAFLGLPCYTTLGWRLLWKRMKRLIQST